MEKKILFLLIAVAVIGCKSYSDFTKIEKKYTINSSDKFFDGRIINGAINGKNVSLLFDTGATKSVLFSYDLLGRESFNENSRGNVFVKGPSGKQLLQKIITDSLCFNSFRSLYQPILVIDAPNKNSCDVASNHDGLLGLDAFSDSNDCLFIDNQKSELKLITGVKDDYQEVESVFSGKLIYLKCEINNRKELFLFDTGADFSVLIAKESDLSKSVESVETLVSTINENKIPQKSKTIFYKLNKISIGGIKFEDCIVANVSTIHRNIIGFNFIKNYNWIIDFKNEKLYAKKLVVSKTEGAIEGLQKISPKAVAIDNKLTIVMKKLSDKNVEVGSQIISVNNEKITPENICRMQKLLNETNDWETLKIEVKPQAKPQS